MKIETKKLLIIAFSLVLIAICVAAYFLFFYEKATPQPPAIKMPITLEQNKSAIELNKTDTNISLEQNITKQKETNTSKISVTNAEIDAVFLSSQKTLNQQRPTTIPGQFPTFSLNGLAKNDSNITVNPITHYEPIKIFGIICEDGYCKAELANKTVKIGDRINIGGKEELILNVNERGIVLKNKFLAY